MQALRPSNLCRMERTPLYAINMLKDVYEALSEDADKQGISVHALIESILIRYTNARKDDGA